MPAAASTSLLKALHPLLQVQADGDTTCPAGQRLGQLVQEAVALQACMAMMNPKGALTWQSRKMDSARGDRTDDPPADLWIKIMASTQAVAGHLPLLAAPPLPCSGCHVQALRLATVSYLLASACYPAAPHAWRLIAA